MSRAIYTLLIVGFSLLPMALAHAQTYSDYVPPIYQTGNGFWSRDAQNDYQYRYTTNDDYNRRQPYSKPQRFYRSHRNVDIRITDSRDPVNTGDALTYFITVGNPYSTTASVDIVAYLDPNTDFRSASNGGQRNGDRVRWRNVIVYGYTNRTISVTVRVDSAVRDAQQLRFRIVAENVSSTEVTRVEDYQRRAPLGPTVYVDDNHPISVGDHGINNTYVQRTTRPVETNERYPDRDFQVTLRKRISDTDALYTLTVENHTNRTLKDVDVVHQFFTHVDKINILSADGGIDKGDRITWDLGWLAPYEYRTLSYRVRFSPNAGSVRTSVQAISRSPALRATTADTMRVGRGGLHYAYNYDAVVYPQTGIANFFGVVLDTSDYLFAAPKTEKVSVPYLWILLASLTGFAIFLQRRLLHSSLL